MPNCLLIIKGLLKAFIIYFQIKGTFPSDNLQILLDAFVSYLRD